VSPEVGLTELFRPVGPRQRRQDRHSLRPVKGKPCVPQMVRSAAQRPPSLVEIPGGGK
jgi:hypothetical protein